MMHTVTDRDAALLDGELYREVNTLPRWLAVPGVIGLVAAGWGIPAAAGFASAHSAIWLILVLVVGVLSPLLLLALRLTVRITPEALVISYRPLARRTIPLGDILEAEAVRYSPILEYGGWGIRWAPGRGMAYTIAGRRGVRLRIGPKGKTILVGSEHPEELLRALNAARCA